VQMIQEQREGICCFAYTGLFVATDRLLEMGISASDLLVRCVLVQALKGTGYSHILVAGSTNQGRSREDSAPPSLAVTLKSG
jgi:hypothetical protein